MDSYEIILIISICLIFIGLILAIYFKVFVAYVPIPTPVETLNLEYYIPSPWSYTDPFDESIPSSDQKTAIPVEGINGQCNIYTFASQGKYTPANIKYINLEGCQNGNACLSGECTCSSAYPSLDTCIDPDQVIAKQMVHACFAYPASFNLQNTTNQCKRMTGEMANVGDVEQFFTNCESKGNTQSQTITDISGSNGTTSNYCYGSLSLLSFNYYGSGVDAYNGSTCITSPYWQYSNGVYSNLDNLSLSACDISKKWNTVPSQLFRVVRAAYTTTFKEDMTGNFCKIVHRPTGYVLTPKLETNGSVSLAIENSTLYLSASNAPYYWYILPDLPASTYSKGYGGKSQFIYVPDPKLIPQNTNANQIWDYLNSNNVMSIQPETYLSNGKYKVQDGGLLLLKKYLYYNYNQPSTETNNSKCMVSKLQYISYSLLPLILSNGIVV